MDYPEFLKQVIEKGIAGAKADFVSEKDKERLQGSIDGFNACTDKLPDELIELYIQSGKRANQAEIDSHDYDKPEGYHTFALEPEHGYWYYRQFQLEVEWVCNCVSVVMQHQGFPPLLSHLPTISARITVFEFCGRKD